MYSPVSNSQARGTRHKAHVAIGCLSASVALTGCATAPGPLFAAHEHQLVWPPSPEPARIRWVGQLTGSNDLKAGRSGREAFLTALRGPRPPIKFSAPHSVARSGDNLLAVTDTGTASVQIIDLLQRTQTSITGYRGAPFKSPVGVAWVGQRLFVTDAGRQEVIEFDVAGHHRRSFGGDDLVRPVGIAYVADRHRLYVVDGGANRIVVFDPDGGLVSSFGGNGTGPGQFNYPSHICWDGRDTLLVADSGNFRVQLLDLDGACLGIMGSKGDGAGDFALPKGVAFDRDGHLYVVDAQFENVQIFDDTGRLLLAFGGEGNAPGEFSLPAGLTIDDNDRIWVADSANRRIAVFSYVRYTP